MDLALEDYQRRGREPAQPAQLEADPGKLCPDEPQAAVERVMPSHGGYTWPGRRGAVKGNSSGVGTACQPFKIPSPAIATCHSWPRLSRA